jgi:redox-sensitive bicupin YhaK (pirin superfamily)
MNTQLYRSCDRGRADFGWLRADFSFSFGNYYNEDRVQFGMLRVLNDDVIAGGAGFGSLPHSNIEIITIPLEGGLVHLDSIGNEKVIRFGEVQVMSAGTGIEHSEMNASNHLEVKTLQLWVFPEKENVTPRYDRQSFDLERNRNKFVPVVTPHNRNDGNSLWVYQQAFFSLGIFDPGKIPAYKAYIPGNGVYLFLIDGEVEVFNQVLNPRDAIGITDIDHFKIDVRKKSKILLAEVPMKHN